jgi:hypothetical protein
MLGKKSRSICKANINNHWQPSCREFGERPVELQLGAITTYQSCRTCFTTYSLLQLGQHKERHIPEYTNESSSRSGQRVCTVQHTCYSHTSSGFKRIDGLTGDVGTRCDSQRGKRRLHRISKETTCRCPEVSTRSHESCAGPDSADNGDGRSRREGTKWHKGMLLSVVYGGEDFSQSPVSIHAHAHSETFLARQCYSRRRWSTSGTYRSRSRN